MMPFIYTTTEGPTSYRYEPGSSRIAEGAKVEIIKLSPIPVEVTEDQARVFCAMHEEVQVVVEPLIIEENEEIVEEDDEEDDDIPETEIMPNVQPIIPGPIRS